MNTWRNEPRGLRVSDIFSCVVTKLNIEAHVVSHIQDHLISGLSFKPSSGLASHVTGARFVTFQAESGDLWSTANRTIRFRLASLDFLDMESIRLHITRRQ